MRSFILISLMLSLCACANHRIDELPAADAGQAFKTRFGTIVSQHRVTIRTSPQTAVSTGIFAAGVAGTLAAVDHATFVGGSLAGGVAAAALHYYGETDNAVEYQIMLDNGTMIILDQLQGSDEPVLQVGAAVVVEFGALSSRVLPMPEGPEIMQAPRRLRLKANQKPQKTLTIEVCNKSNIGESKREGCTKF